MKGLIAVLGLGGLAYLASKDETKTQRNPKTLRGKEYLTLDEAQELIDYFEEIADDIEPDKDFGSSIIGNAIVAPVYEVVKLEPSKTRCHRSRSDTRKTKRLRHDRYVLFSNIWTQGEQERALKEMIDMAKEEFPEYADFIHYDEGRMD